MLLGSFASNAEGQPKNIVIAEASSRLPLPNASLFDNSGRLIGICDSKGRMPFIHESAYPITVRYIGFKEQTIRSTLGDTIFLKENEMKLPEVVVESRQHNCLHIVAYIREYSTLSTYNDTVFLFREKMVDYILNPDASSSFKGWKTPRILAAKSYYRFTNKQGLDSVSDRCRHHFSWTDWVGISPQFEIPQNIRNVECGTDTVMGKYSPTEIMMKNKDRLMVDVNVLADTVSRKWVPNFSRFFRNDVDFEVFRLKLNYDNIDSYTVSPAELSGYSFNIESNGRGRGMFMFNNVDEPFFVSTFAEVYVLDREFITVKEAKKWEKRKFDDCEIEIIEPADAPEIQPAIQQLISRVNKIDHESVRLDIVPDSRLIGRHIHKQENIGQRAFALLKQLSGVTYIKSHRNMKRRWNGFRKEQVHKNSGTKM